jgi:hypothetical protein
VLENVPRSKPSYLHYVLFFKCKVCYLLFKGRGIFFERGEGVSHSSGSHPRHNTSVAEKHHERS